jgi:hypothetical protein
MLPGGLGGAGEVGEGEGGAGASVGEGGMGELFGEGGSGCGGAPSGLGGGCGGRGGSSCRAKSRKLAVSTAYAPGTSKLTDRLCTPAGMSRPRLKALPARSVKLTLARSPTAAPSQPWPALSAISVEPSSSSSMSRILTAQLLSCHRSYTAAGGAAPGAKVWRCRLALKPAERKGSERADASQPAPQDISLRRGFLSFT